MEAETAPIPPCVQYMFRGDSRGTQELPLPGGEKALTCAMFKDAVLQANKISPVVLPPAKLSVCVTHTSDPTNSKEKKLAEHTHSPSRHTFTVREMSDDDEISQNDDDDDCTLVVSLKGTSELLDIVLLCMAQCQTLGLPQVPKIPVAVGTPLNPSDVATLAEFLAAAFGEFRAYPLWEPVNLLTGLLCAISLLTGDSLTMGVVTSSCACIKLVSRIFVFLPSMINVCENSKQLGSYTTIAELCLEIFLNTTLSRVSSWGKPQNTGEGNASSQEKPSGGSAVQIIAEEGAFDAMVYLFSLHVNDALFYKLAARLLDVIGSISCKNPKMLDTFTKSGTLLGALERILSFNYGTSEARDELFDLKMLSLKFISTEMKLSHNFEERASKIDIKRCIADVIAWTAVYFDNSEHAIVMTTKMAPTDDEDYIQEYPKEKSPQIERLGKYLRDEVLDKESKCIASLLSALLEGMQDAISRIPAFAAVAREYPEALCMAVDTVSAFTECDIAPRLKLLQRIYNIWDVLFSDHFIVPKCNKHIHAFLRHKVINFAMLAVGDGTGKDPRELLLAKLYTLFASTSDPEHQVIYTEIIASVVSKYIPDDTTNISMSFNILAISPTIESPELAPRFTLARCGIINSLLMSFDKEDVLSKLVSNMSTFEQLFPLIKVTELEAFVANELVKMFAAAGNAGNDTVLNAMISACLNFIAEFTGKESEEEFSPLITLLRTIEEASQSSAKVREAFGKSSLFSDLLMLMTLQIAKRPDRKISLTSECLRVIYFSSITDFERTIGYEQLKAVLSSFADIFFQDKTEIVDRLFELSLRTRREFFWGATVFTQNTRFIVLICELLPLMGMATIVHTLSRLYTLFQSLPNVAACSSAGLTQVLLEMLEGANVPPGSPIFSDTAVLARLVDAVRLLATHSLSAADLKRVVRLLSRTGPGDTRLSTFPYLIKCLHKTAVAEVDPSAYYNFDGRTSQFKLPSFEYWPFSHGATFFAWLRIESLARRKPVLALDKKVKRDIGFPSPAGTYQLDPAYKPRLLSFMSEDQSEGLELFISDSALYLGITSGRETDLFLCCPDKFALPEKRWFALGITFYTSLIVPTNGELRLYIDGEFVSKTSFTYPRNITSTAYNSVGSSSVPNGDIQSFNGQIGTVFFFDDTLESPQMASLFRYGPEFLGSSKTKAQSGFEDKLLLCYTCKLQDGETQINNYSPLRQESADLSAKTVSVASCVTSNFKSTVNCIDGSIFSLFPLVEMLGKPLSVPDSNAASDSKTLIYIIEIIHDVLLWSSENNELCDEMVSGKGYAVLAHILRQLPSSAFCPNFVKCLIAVYTKMDSIPSARALQDSLYSDLLTNFFVWVRTPYETQKELLSQLYILHSSGKRVISAKSALDILRMFYWLDNTGHTKKASQKKREYDEKDERNAKDVISDSSDDDEKDDDNNNNNEGTSDDNDDDTVNTRLCSDAPFRTDKNAYTELCALRESIFGVVKTKIGQAPELEDVEAVVRFTFWAGCTNRKKHLKVLESEQGDLLGILRVIDDAFEQGSAVFTDAFASIDGAEALLRLLAFKSEVVHVRVIGALARFCYAQLSVSAGRKRVCEIAGSLLEGLADVPVTAVLYNALLKMVIADFSTSDTVEVTHMTNLVLPEAMCICLFPLLRHASQEDRVRAYSDIGTILAKRTNAQCLIEKVRSWQFHLCKLLDGERESFIAWMRTRKEGEDVAESEEIARIIELLGSILSNTVFEAIMLCMDWSEVDALLTLLRVYDAMPVDNAAASLPPNNYFHLCRLAFFKAFTASIARIVNGEAQVEYRDAACATAPQFPFFVSFCVNAVDTLLLIAPSVARPYIYPKCKYSYNQQQQQQQQKGLQKQLARFSPKRIKDSQSACGKDDRAASAQLAPRFESRNIGDAVDPSSSPSDPDFELFILSNILAYVDYLRLCTTSGWGGAEKEKGASPVLQLRPGGFIVLCAITSARILQLHALVGWKDEGRRCKAALALLQTISESLAPQEDEGTANEGFYWIMETTIHSFCVAVTHENMAVAEEIFKLIFTFMRYIGKFKKLGKFISKGSEDAVSILATIAETNSVMDVRNMFVSTAWEPASEEICRRARPWVQAALCGYKKTLIASKKSDEAAVKLAGMAAKQPCLIDSFAACAKVYSLEIFRLEAHALRSSAIQQTNANEWFRVVKTLQRGRGPWCSNAGDSLRKLIKEECLERQRLLVTKARRHGPQKWEATVKCLSAAVAVPDAAFVKKGIPEYESPRDEHVDHALVSSMVSEVDGNDKVLVKVRCEYIRPRKTVSGVFVVSKAGLTFKEADTRRNQEGGNNVSEVRAKTHFWDKDTVCQMYTRRYKLCRTAIEIFFGDKTNCFLNFETVRIRAYVFSKILSGLKPPNLARVVGSSSSPGDALKRSGLTEKWRRREVSNFDYLMALNTMAGRSFNDATQYPVFPWVVSDYTSETLDFSDPMVFRDLSKPIGSHDPGAISLYSSATSVRYFLGRLEPFTSSIIPSTRSDAFTSISAAWARNSWELTPEFFTLPDFLLGGKDGDVALPTWARGSADEFIRINRAALESDYVSAHLNEWVDLVFGCKQRGAEAVETNNLYASIAYEGVIDYTKLRSDVRLQISAFGQIPDQLLASPHPQRVAVAPAEDSGRTSAAVSIFQDPENVLSWAAKVFSGPVVCVRPGAEPGTVIAVNPLCEVCTYRVERRRTDTAPTLRLVSTAQAPSSKPPHLARDTTFSPALFAVSDGRLFSCGFWDGSFRVLSLGTTAPVASVLAHRGIVTCVAAEQGTLVAGFRDTTLMLWDIPPLSAGVAGIVTGNTRKVMNHPRCVLYGHDEKVTAVDISKTLGIVASGALDGRVVVHALRTGKYVWSGVPVLAHPISCVRIIPQAKVIAVYSREKFSIAFCSLSGRTLAELKVQDKFNDMAATADGRFLVLGGKGAMCVFSLSSVSSGTVSFSHAYNIGANVSVCSLAISPDQNVLFAGLDNGNIIAVSGQQQRQ